MPKGFVYGKKMRSDSEQEHAERKAKVQAWGKKARKAEDWKNIKTTAKDVGKEVATDIAIGAATGGVGLIGRAAVKAGAKVAKAGYKAHRARSVAKAGKKAVKSLDKAVKKSVGKGKEASAMVRDRATSTYNKAAQAKTKKIYSQEQVVKKVVGKAKAKISSAAKTAKKIGQTRIPGTGKRATSAAIGATGAVAAKKSAISRVKKQAPDFDSYRRIKLKKKTSPKFSSKKPAPSTTEAQTAAARSRYSGDPNYKEVKPGVFKFDKGSDKANLEFLRSNKGGRRENSDITTVLDPKTGKRRYEQRDGRWEIRRSDSWKGYSSPPVKAQTKARAANSRAAKGSSKAGYKRTGKNIAKEVGTVDMVEYKPLPVTPNQKMLLEKHGLKVPKTEAKARQMLIKKVLPKIKPLPKPRNK